ncbi:MAG: homogentisate 1,2-dioxygenase, partial [Alphaproteobacteria bacterium]|nr:homogentisate 1,2-dioxygenase [Alphaproteobacteria bacterium]
MPKFVSFPHVAGRASRQAHADLPAGTYERELGKEGFYGPATHMYHRHPPTAWTSWEGPLRPRAFDLNRLVQPGDGLSPFAAPPVLGNRALSLSYWTLARNMPALARNADGDQLLFLHQGRGELFCDYGHLALAAGDYVVIPRGTMWRLEPAEPMKILLLEATNSSYQLPDRGIAGAHAIFDPGVLDIPALDDVFLAQQQAGECKVEIKRQNEISIVTYPFNPLDAVGWQGDLTPFRLNVKDIRPLMSHRFHLPPSAHSCF